MTHLQTAPEIEGSKSRTEPVYAALGDQLHSETPTGRAPNITGVSTGREMMENSFPLCSCTTSWILQKQEN